MGGKRNKMARTTLQKIIKEESKSCPVLNYEFQISDPKRRTNLDLQAELVVNMDEENRLRKEFEFNADRTVCLGSGVCAAGFLEGIYLAGNYLDLGINKNLLNESLMWTAAWVGVIFLNKFSKYLRYDLAHKRAMKRDAQRYYNSLNSEK